MPLHKLGEHIGFCADIVFSNKLRHAPHVFTDFILYLAVSIVNLICTSISQQRSDVSVQQLASHGLFNVMVEAEGDTWIDDHHTNEDIGMHA